MGHRCCAKQKVKRGLWSPEEDEKLTRHITTFGHGSWSSVPRLAGLQRCGKSCRLRWINYLRPDLKKGSFTQDEEQIIIDVHRILGNRWAQIAKHLPGRTDNEVKNFWNSCIKKKLLSQGLDPQTHNLISSSNQKALSNKNSTSSFVVSHETQKQPISQKQPTSAFSILNSSSGHEITNICSDDQYIVNPPLLTPPYNAPNNISAVDQYKAPIIGGKNGNDLTAAWTLRDQNSSSVENSTPNISSSSSSSVDIQNFFKSSLIFDDRCGIWDSGLQPFEAPKTVPEGDWKSLQGQVENKYQQQLPEENEKIWEMQNDNNFENYCLDNGFMDSDLMTETLMCHQLSPEQYDLAWNY